MPKVSITVTSNHSKNEKLVQFRERAKASEHDLNLKDQHECLQQKELLENAHRIQPSKPGRPAGKPLPDLGRAPLPSSPRSKWRRESHILCHYHPRPQSSHCFSCRRP